MIFKVKNLGYIEEAEVDLSKDLIVFTGQNNTGKTYLAYAIYGLYTLKYFYLEGEEKYFKEYDEDIEFLTYSFFEEKIEEIISNIEEEVKQRISYLFLADDVSFKNTKFQVNLNEKNIKKLEQINFLSEKHENENISNSLDFLEDIVRTEILSRLFPKTYIAPAERNAINIFSKELSLAKSRVLKSKNGLQKNIQFLNRYPLPIQDSLEIAEDLAHLSRNKSEFEYLAEELEQDFLKGKISTNQYGQIEYSPDNEDKLSLEVHLTASMVKSLSNIVFYLRHLATKGDCIIIDEPELNLHPDNQRKIARFLGRLVNEGFQVIISTHSDYIIKELNNMIMLSKAGEERKDLIEQLGFRGDELIKPEQVEAQLFTLQSRTPQKIEITEEGFEVTTINEVIEKQDNDMETIYYELFQKVV